jgi:transposase InsO family protein
MFGVTRQLVLPHHPRANGQVERFFRVFRSMLTAVMVNLPERYQHRWDEYVHHAAYAYNTSIHRSTGATPFFLFHGHHPETILHEPLPAEVPEMTGH